MRDVARYLYCEKFNTPAYPGSYGEQPYKWIQKANIIRNGFAKLEKQQIDKAKQNGKSKNINS